MICSGATRLSAQEIMRAFGLWPSATSFANRSVRLGKTRFSKSNTRPMRSFMKPLLAGWFHAHGDRILLRCSVNVSNGCSSGRNAQAGVQPAEVALVEFRRAAGHPPDAIDDPQAQP